MDNGATDIADHRVFGSEHWRKFAQAKRVFQDRLHHASVPVRATIVHAVCEVNKDSQYCLSSLLTTWN
jgi:hypothetical protein